MVKMLQIHVTSTKQTKKPKEQSRKYYVNYQVKFQEVYDGPKPWFRFQNGSTILALGTTWQHVLVIFATWFLEVGGSLVIEKMLKVPKSRCRVLINRWSLHRKGNQNVLLKSSKTVLKMIWDIVCIFCRR